MNFKPKVLIFISLIVIGGIVFMRSLSKWTDKYDALFIKYANLNGLDWKMLKAISMNESSLGKNKGYEPKGGTTGLMQIQIATASRFIKDLTSSQLVDDEIQIKAASEYLKWLKNRFKNDVRKMVISYNQGEGRTDKGLDYTKDYYDKYINHYQEIA
jgi:membrane-bound lytic murein transglycosylase MltF